MCTDNPSSVSIQTSAEPIASVPAWFGEVALIAHTLTRLGLLSEISEHVRFARKRFGTFEVIDFVVVLMGYAISGEPTLKAYYERLQPFATPFMALFGRKQLPHRSTLSRFLAALDQRRTWGACGSAGKPMDRLRSRWYPTGCTTTRSASGS